MHAEAHTCMHMQYFILLYILACTHKHTCASPRYRPYAGYCQHEHVIEHTQLYKTNSLISIQRKYAPKKKKRFLNATWHSSSIHGCSAEVHWSHCVTHWLSMQIKLSKSDTQCVCDRERKTECSGKVSARKNERESRANADRSFAVKPEKSDLIWSKLKE